jgi:hypothetical protein
MGLPTEYLHKARVAVNFQCRRCRKRNIVVENGDMLLNLGIRVADLIFLHGVKMPSECTKGKTLPVALP